ncbi:RICIN domain-containing protein [Blautia sp. MSJ-19]|uniref:RICIN domain-containing protein n=1 Tax=Blautia sp. MSJ-19 TaxID=2841517 RepID=UPI001C0EFEC7|nr:RICIN domain-containing protein [Blautia sp. MSJ-19]MBU5480814.1 RICIN domain-containing protein [Blautia sp. MSJ-19]
MKKKVKKWLSCMMAAAMVMSTVNLPVDVFASEFSDEEEISVEDETEDIPDVTVDSEEDEFSDEKTEEENSNLSYEENVEEPEIFADSSYEEQEIDDEVESIEEVSVPAVGQNSKSRQEAVNWAYAQEGKFLDYDGAYGAQCVDLIKYYYAYFGVAGYAKGNGCDYVSNTLPNGWTRIKNTPDFVPEPGDIAVWGTELSSAGHVAIILSANSHSFVSMDQNWPRGSSCKQVTHTYSKFWGVIRPNFTDSDPTPTPVDPITTTPSIWTNSDSYTVGDAVKFSWNSVDHATGYWFVVWYKGEQIVTTAVDGNSEYTLYNLKEGGYTAFITAYNDRNSMENSATITVNYPTGEDIISNGRYQICTALDNSSVVSVSYASAEDEANVLLYENENHQNQMFDFEYMGNGYYKITAVHSGKCLDIYNHENGSGANVQQFYWTDADNQKWIVKEAGDGYFYIISRECGLYLDVYGGKAENNANIDVYSGHGGASEKWRLIPCLDGKQEIEDGIYTIQSALDNQKSLNVAGNSVQDEANIEIGSEYNTYKITYLGDGCYQMLNTSCQKSLDAYSSDPMQGKKRGTNVQQYGWNGGDNQKWILKSAGNGQYYIICKSNGLYLDVYDGKSDEGQNVDLWVGNGNTCQKWTFVPLDLSRATVQISNDQYVYNGKAQTPGVSVKREMIELVKDVDFKVSYSNNVNVGTATVTITGIGKYTGTVTRQFEIKKSPVTASLSASPSGNVVVGSQVKLTASAGGGSGDYTYKFWISDKDNENWKVLRDYEKSNAYTWTPDASGKIHLYADVKDSAGTIKRAGIVIEIKNKVLTASLSALPSGNAVSGSQVKLTASANGGSGNYIYKFWVSDESNENWYLLRDYGKSSTYSWTLGATGKKHLYVDIKDSTGTVKRAGMVFEVTNKTLTANLTASPSGSAISGTQVKLNAKATGGSGSYTYKFIICDDKGNWYKIRDFGASSTCTWTPGAAGKKTLYVDVKDSTGTVKRAEMPFTVQNKEIGATLTASPSGSVASGTQVKLSAKATGGSGSYIYKFIICDDKGNWYKIRDFGTSATCTWTPGAAGKKTLYVDVKDSTGTVKRAALSFEVR